MECIGGRSFNFMSFTSFCGLMNNQILKFVRDTSKHVRQIYCCPINSSTRSISRVVFRFIPSRSFVTATMPTRLELTSRSASVLFFCNPWERP